MQRNSVELSKRPWTNKALAALAVILLAAVPALGLTTLGPEFFPSAPALADNLQTAGVSNGPLTFDAPTVTLQKSRAADVQAASGGEDCLLFTDWRFTKGLNLNQINQGLFILYHCDPAGFVILSFQTFYVWQHRDVWTQQQRLTAYFIIYLEARWLLKECKKEVSPSM